MCGEKSYQLLFSLICKQLSHLQLKVKEKGNNRGEKKGTNNQEQKTIELNLIDIVTHTTFLQHNSNNPVITEKWRF